MQEENAKKLKSRNPEIKQDRRMEEKERGGRKGREVVREGEIGVQRKKFPLPGRNEKVGRAQPLDSSKRAADLVLAHRPLLRV